MKRIIFATGNEGKLREIRRILEGMPYEVVSMKEANVQADIVEDGKTFEENALIKARTVSRLTGEIAMADDSGLVIDYLNGEPGIYSSRYMGEDTSYDIKNKALIDALAGVPDPQRTARFVCAAACVWPDGREKVCTAAMEGRIGYEIAGKNGCGYDPIFSLPKKGMTSAEISPEEKNEISHRGKALRQMKKILEETVD